MLKVTINKEKIEILQNHFSDKQTADEIAIIIDRITIDEYIKPSPKILSSTPEKQKTLIQEKRKEICNFILNAEIDLTYISSDDSSDIYEKSDIIETERIQFN